jgi:hypothetical protein
MSNGYFIAPDAYDDIYLWREAGDFPIPVIGRDDFGDDPAVWDAIVAWVRVQS